ncbi:MAG: chorismate synthase [Bacteroidales bacterium]|nr:chorismate synthase [Bacteroidales bacterium]
MNTFGRVLRLTGFGESHGEAIGGVLDGLPAGLEVDMEYIQAEMRKRRPGDGCAQSRRKEEDRLHILSGIYRGKSTGTPIAFVIPNQDARSWDYAELEDKFRPSHADDTYQSKYGLRDPRGGGRASARETAVRVAAGALAKLFLASMDISIKAYAEQIGEISLPANTEVDADTAYAYVTRCPHKETDAAMQAFLEKLRRQNDSTGGVIRCQAEGLPKGLGEPVYDKLTSRLASAMLSINACRGFEIGQGFAAAGMKGSEHNDVWLENGHTQKNLCGGVRGGISTGETLYFRTAFKPIPSIGQEQNLLGEDHRLHSLQIKGRHDVCCVPRAVAVVEAMTALTIADFVLLARTNRI